MQRQRERGMRMSLGDSNWIPELLTKPEYHQGRPQAMTKLSVKLWLAFAILINNKLVLSWLSLTSFLPSSFLPSQSPHDFLPTYIIYSKYYSIPSSFSDPPPPTSRFSPCPLSCCPQLKPNPTEPFCSPTLCVLFPRYLTGNIYACQDAHFFQ